MKTSKQSVKIEQMIKIQSDFAEYPPEEKEHSFHQSHLFGFDQNSRFSMYGAAHLLANKNKIKNRTG